MSEKTYTVTHDGGIKDFLKREAGLSTRILKQVKYGGVSVNGEVVHMRAQLRIGDTVTVRFPEDRSNIEPLPLPLDVLYEDEDILAVCKPCGMPMHPCRGNHLPTLANAAAAYTGGEMTFRAIGRLDRDTSGVVILAKSALAAHRLSQAMKDGAFEKIYVAVVSGTPSPPCGRIDAPIAREAEGAMRRVVRADGKAAITDYACIGRIGDDSLVQVRLLTGRTHQIRVHMAHIGHPLVDDFLYGKRREGATFRLHAQQISFPHPTSGERMTVCAPIPSTWRE